MPGYSGYDNDVDESLRPDLAAQHADARTQQAMTNRLYALSDYLSRQIEPPARGGVVDKEAWERLEATAARAMDAVRAIAVQTINWTLDCKAASDGRSQ